MLYPADVRRALADGLMFATVEGSGPVDVVALHGWARTARDFAVPLRGTSSYAIDLPGFGSSPRPLAAWGAAQYADLLAKGLADIGQSVVMVGHSFGGRVATHLAATRPDLVRSLILTGVPLLRTGPATKPALPFRIARTLHRRGLVSDERMEAMRHRHGSADYRAADGVMREILVRVVNESYEEQLRAIECRVHLVWGGADTAVPVSIAEGALEILGDRGSLHIERGIGHLLPVEAPNVLRSAIDELLAT